MTLFLSQRAALSSSFHSVLSILPSFLQTSVSAHRIKELVDLPKEVHIARSSELDAYIEQGFTVNMDDVNFSYISMKKRFTRLAVGLLSYYVVSLIFVPLVKDGISGAPGTFVSCYLQILYVSFIFPRLIKRFEKA